MPFGRRRTAHSKVYPLYFSPIPDDADEGLFEVRTRLIDQVERFVSQTGLLTVRPLDVVLADHALHLEWKKLGFVPHEFAGSGLEAPFQVVVGEVTPAMVLDVLALVAHEALLAACPPPPDAEHTADRLCERRLRVQLHSHGPPTPMSDLRADKIGKLVTVVGSVIRVSSLRPYVSSIGFLCPRCGHTMERCLVDGKYVPPDGCERGGCRVKHLLPDRTTAKTRDFQKVRLQEVPEENLSEFYGRVPRTVEVELLDTLVDTCVPGDIVSVTGIVKSVEVANEGGGFAGGRSSKPKCMYLLYLEAVSLTNTRAAAPAAGAAAAAAEAEAAAAADDARAPVAFSLRDMQEIARLHANYEGQLFDLLTASMCPTIFGHEVVKVGLILGLFGGTRKSPVRFPEPSLNLP